MSDSDNIEHRSFWNDARNIVFCSMSKKQITTYKNMSHCKAISVLSFFAATIIMSFNFIDSFSYFNTITALILCTFILIAIIIYFSIRPDKFFYNNITSKISFHSKRLKEEFQENNDKRDLSESMLYWHNLHNSCMEESGFLHISSELSKSLHKDINHQDSKGNTILHYMLTKDPQSPFIAQALLLHADIYLTNNKNISVYALLQEHKPEYLIFIEKNQLINSISTSASRPLARL